MTATGRFLPDWLPPASGETERLGRGGKGTAGFVEQRATAAIPQARAETELRILFQCPGGLPSLAVVT